MKNVFLFLALLFMYNNINALEPVRVAIVTTSGNTLNVDVELYDYSNNTSLHTLSLGALTANSSGIISFIVDNGTPAWSTINSSSINSNVVLNVKTGGTLYAQYRLDNLIIVQAQSGNGIVSEPTTSGKLIDISSNNVISKINNLQIITMSPNVTVDADNTPEGIFRFDMTSNNIFTIDDFTNVVDGGVYTFHFDNATAGGNVTFPSSFVKENGSSLGNISLATSKMVTFYYYQNKNYTTEQ